MRFLATSIAGLLIQSNAFAIDGSHIKLSTYVADNKVACAAQVASQILGEVGLQTQSLQFSRQGRWPYTDWYKFGASSGEIRNAEVWVRMVFKPTFGTNEKGQAAEKVLCTRAVFKGTFFELKEVQQPISLCDWYDPESFTPCGY